jgi:hypothetical protein
LNNPSFKLILLLKLKYSGIKVGKYLDVIPITIIKNNRNLKKSQKNEQQYLNTGYNRKYNKNADNNNSNILILRFRYKIYFKIDFICQI